MRGFRIFFSGGGGQAHLDNVFFKYSTYFRVYRGCPVVLLQRKLCFSKGPGGPTFSRAGPTFSRGWGVQMLISIETDITCDFPGGPDPLSTSGSAH